MKLTLRAKLPDQTFEVTTSFWVLVEWERKYKSKASNMKDGIGVEDLAFMAWSAAKLNTIVVPAVFDDFCKKLLEPIEVVSEEIENPIQGELTED
jgi:hypothetical protein